MVVALLMLLNLVAESVMDGLDQFHIAGITQSFAECILECFFLLSGRHGGCGMKYAVDDFLVDLICLSGIEQGIVDIGRTIVKGGEQESQFRCGNNLAGTTVELIVSGEEAKLSLALLHRTDTANDIGEYGIGCICIHLVVFVLMGNIVCVMCQEDQVIAVPKVKRVDDFLIELLTDVTVFQLRIAQRHEEAMLITVSYLLCGEDNINQVLPKFAGKSLLQQIQVLLCFVLRENPHGFIDV